eukprot:1817321-Pyramimonas_sp.AAC.1
MGLGEWDTLYESAQQPPKKLARPRESTAPQIGKASGLVQMGELSHAARLLSSPSLAPATEETLKELRDPALRSPSPAEPFPPGAAMPTRISRRCPAVQFRPQRSQRYGFSSAHVAVWSMRTHTKYLSASMGWVHLTTYAERACSKLFLAHTIFQGDGGEQGDALMLGLFCLAINIALRRISDKLQPGASPC